ncbi:zinc ribbon domain-containing protein [Knoellia sp. Soil729]|uniref:zinc ribbon domain-containing protein n=1 Tax=Knoellia sp. Soil729 TaxID=1736394 RepID=UPI0006FF96C3|nr:zinc ribbon domain-containing protein [Knoellia sp. Soil729]KRE42879.1 hypothetical protein ASG74_10995 [Knoellia sp. Soil729]
MHCRSCGADLPDRAEYCPRCGARVELGSVLGVGTDLPPMPPREEADEPTDLSQTRELPRVAGTAVPVAAGAQASPPPGAPQPSGPLDEEDPKGSGHSRGSILAMVATFVVLTLIGTFALTRLVGSDDPQPSATAGAPTTSQSTSGSGQPSPTPSSTSASTPAPSTATPSGTPSASASATTAIPAGARRCSTSGSDAVATAYAGTERTSCEFAAAVREAYRSAGTPDGATTLRAYSPVTKKWYSLSCDGGEPVTCTSTTNAVVLLAP